MSRKPTQGIDYTSKDYEAFRELMVQKLQEKMPEYTDTSETDAGIVILEALANGLDILSLYLDIIANDVILPTTQDRKLAVIISKCLGYTPYNQTASEYPQVFVLSEKRSEATVIPRGTIVKTPDSSDLATLTFETMEDLIIPANCLGNEKDDDGNYLYTVRIQQGESVYQDVIGTSSGAPLQSFQLNYLNVLVDSLEVLVNEGYGQEVWTRVDSFIDCNEDSKVYMTTVDEFNVCTIEFGNGLKGKIPVSYPSGIIANYRIGGGEAGNVSANIITELDTSIAYVEETFNLEATVLGHEKESLESIKENAPANFRVRDRIITLTDYEDIIRLNFYDFLRLKAVQDSVDKKLVHIYYMMRPDYKYTSKLSQEVVEFVSSRTILGTTFDINPYVPQEVNLTCVMYVDRDYDKDELKANAEAYLDGVTFHYGELLFGDSIVKSDLESEIKDTFDGILSFRINTPTSDIISPTQEQNVLVKGKINIEAKYL